MKGGNDVVFWGLFFPQGCFIEVENLNHNHISACINDFFCGKKNYRSAEQCSSAAVQCAAEAGP
jgi:hypothetical protein